MNTLTDQTSSSPIGAAERFTAIGQLTATRDALLQMVAELNESQCDFKTSGDSWSILEIVEHLVLIENRIHGVVAKMSEAPTADPGHSNTQIEEIILSEIPVRSTKLSAPAPVTPTRQWVPKEAFARFEKSRAATIALLDSAPALRGRVIPHPLFGPWDGYQWILATAAHTTRHTIQIAEIKADAAFPSAAQP